MVFISIERWFSVWKPFDKAKYVTFRTTIIAVVSYTSVSIINFSWFPLTLKYSPDDGESPETCAMQRPTVYKVFGTISVVFTYISSYEMTSDKKNMTCYFRFLFSQLNVYFSPIYFSRHP